MRYIQNWFRGHLRDVIHIIKGPYAASAAVKWSDAANLVETWCDQVFQDREGLLPGQDTEMWRQGVGSDQVNTLYQQKPKSWWRDSRGVCSSCLKVLQRHTEYPGQLAAMENDALYQEFCDAHEPDCWECEFTTDGKLRLRLVIAEMERRLRGCGFLSKEVAS